MNEESQKQMNKARRSVEAAQALLDRGDADFAASRAYYAMFYAAEALLNADGLSSTKHSGVHALFAEHFARTRRMDPKFHRSLLDAFDNRVESDYGFESTINSERAAELIDGAREFLNAAETFFHPGGADPPIAAR